MSIPRGVGAPPPPGLDPKRGKLMCIKVRLLDDSVAVFHLGVRQSKHGEHGRFSIRHWDNSCWMRWPAI